MEIKFLEPVMVKSQLRRIFEAGNKKSWITSRYKHPKRGIIIGWRTLADGWVEYFSDEAPIFHPQIKFQAVLVIFDEKQNPVYVLPGECYEVPVCC